LELCEEYGWGMVVLSNGYGCDYGCDYCLLIIDGVELVIGGVE